MCGRFTSYHSSSEIADIFNLIDVPQLEPRYNIAPTQQVAAIVVNNARNDTPECLKLIECIDR